jgi:hypothetical protein
VFAFKVLSLGSYAPMPGPSLHFKTILELVLWNGLHSCHRITPDAINVKKMPFSIFRLSLGTEKSHWGQDQVNSEYVPAKLFVY